MDEKSWLMQVIEAMRRDMGVGYDIFLLRKKNEKLYQIGVRSEQDPVGIVLSMEECKRQQFENEAGVEKTAAFLMKSYEGKMKLIAMEMSKNNYNPERKENE